MGILNKIWRRNKGGRETPKGEQDTDTDLLHPPYFSGPRCADLRNTFERAGVEVKNITIME